MRMRFTVDDELAYQSARAELCDEFAAWQARNGVEPRPDDVELLLDWKWGYADGDLAHWTVEDIDGFLLGWCPAKLSAPPDLAATVPDNVASFMEFLAHRGLLAPGNPAPSVLRQHCEQLSPRFQHEMADPANFGMAKALFGDLSGIGPGELAETSETSEPAEKRVIGPVRLPDPEAHLESLRRSIDFRQVRGLAERCPAPGLSLTKKGNLRLADARRLVGELETGDELDTPFRDLASAEHLPRLSRVLELAIAAGAVRRHRGKLVAVSAYARLDDAEAYRRLVRAVIQLGPSETANPLLLLASEPLSGRDDGMVERLLAELLDVHVDGVQWLPIDPIIEHFAGLATMDLPGLAGVAPQIVGDQVVAVLDMLVDLGVLDVAEDPGQDCRCVACAGQVALTPAGITVAAESVAVLPQFDVVFRPDLAEADATTVVATLGQLDEQIAVADLVAWSATRPAGTAAAELVAAVTAADRSDPDVLGGLDLAERVLGQAVAEAVRAHLDGPHDPLVLTWLITRGELDPATVDRSRMMAGMAAVAAVFLDVEGPDGVVEFFDSGGRAGAVDLLEQLWRVDHPRVADVLEAMGRQHPDPKVAKTARRNLMRYRSRVAAS